MPIYEYQCPECATVSEFILKFSDPAPTECPACGKTVTMTKKMSATNFHLKGGGWFKDQYDSASNRKPGSDSAKNSDAKGSDTKGSDAKSSGDAAKAAPSSESSSSSSSPSSSGSSSSPAK